MLLYKYKNFITHGKVNNAMELNNCFKLIIIFVIITLLLMTGCSNQLINYEVENEWTSTLKEVEIDYKKFSPIAQSSIYELRDDIDDFSPDMIREYEHFFRLFDLSEMEKDAIVSAHVENSFICSYIFQAYANAKAINYAVKEYCEKCYEFDNIVKEGKYSFRISFNSPNGDIKYNGKISDLKKYLNKYIHPEARNGYCSIEINSYNAPVLVCWSKEKIDKSFYEEKTYYQNFNTEEIQNGISVVGISSGTFNISNSLTYNVVSKTSISPYLGDLDEVTLSSDDVETILDELYYEFKCDIEDSIDEDEFKTKENNKKILQFGDKSTSSNTYLEQNSDQSNNNIKTIIDPFDGIEVQYDGASPYLSATVNTLGCNEYVKKYVTFKIDKSQLRKGENFIISAKWNESEFANENISFSQSEKEFVVENVSFYIESLNDIDISELNQLMDDFVEANSNKVVGNYWIFERSITNDPWHNQCNYWTHDLNIDKINSFNVLKEYFCSFKQPSTLEEDKVYNKYVRIYEVNYNVHCHELYTSGTTYIAVFMDNILIGNDGELKYNSTEPLNSNLLYYKSEGTVSIIESNYVISEKAIYNVNQIK